MILAKRRAKQDDRECLHFSIEIYRELKLGSKFFPFFYFYLPTFLQNDGFDKVGKVVHVFKT